MGKSKNLLLVTALLVILLGNMLVVPVGAQTSDPASNLLDGESEQVGQIDMQGSTYTVYEVDNLIPYASGVEVYADGQRVTDKAKVKPVLSQLGAKRTLSSIDTTVKATEISSTSEAQTRFTIAAWQVSANEITEDDIQKLRQISKTSDQIDEIVSPTLSAINTVLNVFQQMRNTGILGVTVWDVATEAYPQMETFENSLEQTRTELSEWNQAAEKVTSNIKPTITALEKARQGQNIDYSKVANQLQAAESALDQLQSKSDEVESSLSSTSDTAATVASTLQGTQVPNNFISPISELSQRLDSAATEVNKFSQTIEESRSELSSTRQKAQNKQQQFMDQWKSDRSQLISEWEARKSVQMRVYGTLGGIAIGALGLILFGLRFT